MILSSKYYSPLILKVRTLVFQVYIYVHDFHNEQVPVMAVAKNNRNLPLQLYRVIVKSLKKELCAAPQSIDFDVVFWVTITYTRRDTEYCLRCIIRL